MWTWRRFFVKIEGLIEIGLWVDLGALKIRIDRFIILLSLKEVHRSVVRFFSFSFFYVSLELFFDIQDFFLKVFHFLWKGDLFYSIRLIFY